MNQTIILTIIEFIASVLIEGVIITFIFQKIGEKNQAEQAHLLETEMNNIEKQNKFIFQQLQTEIREAKAEIISQIKESERKKG